jgi:DNA-binding Lrp family transcriptional regulator
MKAYILIKIRVGAVLEAVQHLRRIERVLEAHMTFGPYDAVAVVQADDINHLGTILNDAIQPIPGVQETLTCLAVEA